MRAVLPVAVYNTYSAVLRSMGDSKAPFYAILVSSGMNMLFDTLLVAVFHCGIAGAAWATVVAITSAYRVDTVALLPVVNLGSAITTFTAQSFGAKNQKRIDATRKAGLVVMAVASITLTALVIPFGSRFVAIFGVGEEAVAIAHNFFLHLASFYLVFGLYNAIRGYLEGIGDVVFSSAIGIVSLLVRVIGSYTLPYAIGNMIIAYAEGISWVVALILFAGRAYTKRRQTVS